MELGRNLDWTDEVRESAAIRMADYQQRASAHYNRKVRPRSFKNANSRSSSSFCATKRSCKSSLCFFSIEILFRSASPPPQPVHHLLPQQAGSLIPPGLCSAKSTRRASFSSEWWIAA
ncbi:hypothetical protein CK203_029880 [Vitis vinifera]|uniref:Uncharacterized protein n=1 Tax=Vitis vinifera TaxID=29760 RepID=A0A438IDC5_VITVI|nr:hypothetical protein CK203_029880 [Vitis vinifera]